jgi:hypothetical protein
LGLKNDFYFLEKLEVITQHFNHLFIAKSIELAANEQKSMI